MTTLRPLTKSKIGEAVGVSFSLSNWHTEPENTEIRDFNLIEPDNNNNNNNSSKYSVNKSSKRVDSTFVNTAPDAKAFSAISVEIPKILLSGEVSASQKGQISLTEKKRPGLFRRRSSSYGSGLGGAGDRANMAGLLAATASDYASMRRNSYGGRSSRDDWTTEIVDGVLETNLCSTEL